MTPSMFDAKHVPIVGQGVRVMSYTLLPVVLCDCGHLDPMTLMAQAGQGQITATIATCSGCQATYQIVGLTMDARGQLIFNLDQKKPVSV